MKILMLCKKFPWPMRDGESIAISNLARELRSLGCEITLLSMNTAKHYTDPNALPADYDFFHSIETVDIDNRVRPWKALTSLIQGESYHIRRFRSGKFQAKLIELLRRESFDIVQLETLYMAPYVAAIRRYSKARIVMRAHNIEHEIWERITRNSNVNLRKLYLAFLTRQLRQYELDQFDAYDYLVTLTERDLRLFRSKGYVNGASAAPIGFDFSAYPQDEPIFGPGLSIGFIGSLDWMPNREGLEWFLDECWPEVHRRWPAASLHIAGRNTPADLLQRRIPGVRIHGEVEDAATFIARHAMMIVPLLSGSGMRVKVVESMAMGRVVVTTALGLEGIDARNRQELLIADDPKAFIESIGWCIDHPEAAARMGRAARERAAALFDGRSAAREMMRIYRMLLAGGAGHIPARAVPTPH